MEKEKYPHTLAIRQLKDSKAVFIPHQYNYEDKGGTSQTAKELKISEHSVVKTLVFETGSGKVVIVLMHGDMEVSTKELARILGEKNVLPCSEKKALAATGYLFGGTSPFGLRKNLPIYAEATIFDLPKIYINGGKRGFIVEIEPGELKRILNVKPLNAAIKK